MTEKMGGGGGNDQFKDVVWTHLDTAAINGVYGNAIKIRQEAQIAIRTLENRISELSRLESSPQIVRLLEDMKSLLANISTSAGNIEDAASFSRTVGKLAEPFWPGVEVPRRGKKEKRARLHDTKQSISWPDSDIPVLPQDMLQNAKNANGLFRYEQMIQIPGIPHPIKCQWRQDEIEEYVICFWNNRGSKLCELTYKKGEIHTIRRAAELEPYARKILEKFIEQMRS